MARSVLWLRPWLPGAFGVLMFIVLWICFFTPIAVFVYSFGPGIAAFAWTIRDRKTPLRYLWVVLGMGWSVWLFFDITAPPTPVAVSAWIALLLARRAQYAQLGSRNLADCMLASSIAFLAILALIWMPTPWLLIPFTACLAALLALRQAPSTRLVLGVATCAALALRLDSLIADTLARRLVQILLVAASFVALYRGQARMPTWMDAPDPVRPAPAQG